MTQLLTEMDGIEDLKGVTILAATNRLDQIDAALLRPGRFDFQIALPCPDTETRLAILRVHTGRMPLGTDVDLAMLAEQPTAGMVGADLEALCRHAGMGAIWETLQNTGVALVVGMRHFKEALMVMKQIPVKRD
ncbi:MAG: transitional endoplasmic reticulum ATPase [Rhodospirillaceae bacterium]|nr:MAG: transitional endoplasmic reticulum ATPase [Rhodospirillaceae bacterium]